MRLLEYQAKKLFSDSGITVPKGLLAENFEGVRDASKSIGFPLVLKAQVLVGGRGKAGAIKIVKDLRGLEGATAELMKTKVSGVKADKILIEEFIPHEMEFYLSIALERSSATYLAIASKEGGVDVESLKSKVIKDIGLEPVGEGVSRTISKELGLQGKALESFSKFVMNLSKLSEEYEAELAEVNPLAITREGDAMALDAKLIIDDNSLFRHPEIVEIKNLDAAEEEASRHGFSYVSLEGDAGVIGNGAGLVLSTLDSVVEAGLRPACFLDLGGGASKERIIAALELADRVPNLNTILINVFGGITRCTDVAEAVLELRSKKVSLKPLYIRLSGAGSDEAKVMLKDSKMNVFDELEEALSLMIHLEGDRR